MSRLLFLGVGRGREARYGNIPVWSIPMLRTVLIVWKSESILGRFSEIVDKKRILFPFYASMSRGRRW